MPTLKVFFHDNCFDGAASAALFADVYRQCVRPADVAFQGVQHKPGDPFAGLVLDGDDNACVDFRYSPDPRMTWWFDHHVSAFQPPELRAHFEADGSGQKFYDPTARSCTKFLATVAVEQLGYQLPEGFVEVVHWADIIDGARFADAATAVELEAPATRLMTWLEHNHDPALAERTIRAFGARPLAELADEAWIREPVERLLEEHRHTIEHFRHHARCDGRVCFFDVTSRELPAYNKFIPYFLFPEAEYTVVLSRSRDRVKVSAGRSPWAVGAREHDIARICERYGGGGHPVVGAISLAAAELPRAREIADEIREELER